MTIYVLFSILYCGFFLWALYYWKKIDSLSLHVESDGEFSIIIPVRNEAENIQHLLTDLENLDFPKERFEVIFINDHSRDHTMQVLKRALTKCTFSYQVHELADYFRAGKKEAITLGVKKAKFDHIITTDADCSIPPGWLAAYVAAYMRHNAVMITGPVRMIGEGLFEKFQSYEFAGLIGVGAATLSSGNPTMCNGANLSYRKEAFWEVEGYMGNSDIPSGDDEFLLQKLYRRYPDRVIFLKDQKAILTTPAKKNLKELVNQRIRWSSKWRHHKSWFIQAMAILAFLNCLAFVIGLVVSIVEVSVYTFLIILYFRWLAAFIFIYSVKRFLSLGNLLLVSIVMEIIYPFFVIFLGLASIFGKYSWKGRQY